MLTIADNDLTDIACNIKYTDCLNNGASSLTFDYPNQKADIFPNGSAVTFSHGGVNVFYGFLFTSKVTEKTISCEAYDQLRYLKAEGFMVRKGETLDAFANRIFSNFATRISLGQIDGTGAVLSDKIFDGKSYLDMIYQSVRETTLLNGYLFALRDEYGALTLRNVYDLRIGLIIGDGSMATGYCYERSIDKDTYNVINVAQDNENSGQRDVVTSQDSESISKWGKLQLYQTTSGRNDAQLKSLAANILLLKDRETETLTLDCIGDLRLRAGTGVKVQLQKAGVDLWAIVDKAVHTFEGAKHTMRLDMLYGRWATWLT